MLQELKSGWPKVILQEDTKPIQNIANKLFQPNAPAAFNLHLEGTDFQKRVWQALLKIPFGKRVSYEEVAQSLNMPKAIRAVASAIAKNQISYIIPCHRVIRKNGQIHNYRWGSERKKAILDWEASKQRSA
jgi:AraC family transcriptional regulator of adaptative response/methylated-DNA-[protein]-cysteine methyltransferase